MYIDTSSAKVQKAQKEWWSAQKERLDTMLRKSRVDSVSVRTDQDYVKALMQLFAQRN